MQFLLQNTFFHTMNYLSCLFSSLNHTFSTFTTHQTNYTIADIIWYNCISIWMWIGKHDSLSCVFESIVSQESTLYPSNTYLNTSAVIVESNGWSLADDVCCWKMSSFWWIAGEWMCKAVFKNTGQTFSRCGHEDQNHEGIRPVGAVDTK